MGVRGAQPVFQVEIGCPVKIDVSESVRRTDTRDEPMSNAHVGEVYEKLSMVYNRRQIDFYAKDLYGQSKDC